MEMELDALFNDLDAMLKDSIEEFDTCVTEDDKEVVSIGSVGEEKKEKKTVLWGWLLVVAMAVIMLFFLLRRG